MTFRTNTSKASEGFTLKPEGDYEVVIDKAELAVTKNGKENISLSYIIRNDVAQGCQNGLIFHSIWKKSDDKQNEDDKSIDGFNFAQLMAVVEAANLPDGKEYAALGDLLTELEGKAIKVHLFHDDFNDKYYEKVDRHMPTDFPKIKHKAKNPTTATSKPSAVPAAPNASAPSAADDNYPF